jgi:cysteinyl-tRNA synthetase, unknown class
METILLILILLAAAVFVVLRLMAPPKSAEPGASPIMSKSRTPETAAVPAASAATSTDSAIIPRTAAGTGLFEGVRTWGYQLQNVSMKAVAASPFDLFVIDYSKDGSDAKAFTPGDVARMKVKPDGSRRQVIAYMSIGEAESYRYYWNPEWSEKKPSWLLDENPDWKENFSVCYWDPAWQNQFCGNPSAYLDKIIAAGFDGVYLDKCDVFEDLQDRNKKVAKSRPDLEGDMINFVARLSQYAKARKPTFAVIMQNAEILLEQEPLREAIDGVAKEALLYGLPGPELPNPKDEVTFSHRALDLAVDAGRTVFVVEYLDDPQKVIDATVTLDGWGYLSTIAPKARDLAAANLDPAAIVFTS